MARTPGPDYSAMREWATERQAQAIDAIAEFTTQRAAAKAMGITQRALWSLLTTLKRKAAQQGHAPRFDMVKEVPEGYHVKGTSTYYRVRPLTDPETGEPLLDNEGNVRLIHTPTGQWVKSNKDQEDKLDQLFDAIRNVAAEVQGKYKPLKSFPKDCTDDLLCCYPWGDPHIGMLAWAKETQDRNYDLSIAERVHLEAMDKLVHIAPRAKRAALISVGDLFHADNQQNRTMRSGHLLDVDARYPKVYEAVFRTLIESVKLLLRKHELVDVISVPGNHDDVSAWTIAFALAAWFRNEPRVRVNTDPTRFVTLVHGNKLIGVTHGDTMKPQAMGQLLAADYAKEWGAAIVRHIYSGHLHTDISREFPGVTVETIRTMAARDAYSSFAAYRSRQDMKCDIWHTTKTGKTRNTVGIEDLDIAA